jgi:molybdopterin synthase sulfur carrier subunit
MYVAACIKQVPDPTSADRSGHQHRELPLITGASMQVTVKLFATFRNARFKIAEQDLAEGTECRRVVLDLGLAEEEIGIIMINGRDGSLEQKLCAGDVLSLFPLIGGG